MTLSTKIEVFTDFTFVRSGPSYTCTAVARSLCVSWAFLFLFESTSDSVPGASSELVIISLNGRAGNDYRILIVNFANVDHYF